VNHLVSTVTVPARSRARITFLVSVPAHTPPGQYLAGVTAELAAKPESTRVAAHKKASASVTVTKQVTVGVAVTVGSLSAMTTRLRISGVSAVTLGSVTRLNIALKNTGQTFTGAKGSAYCTASDGTRHVYIVRADTVLPNDTAQIPANAPGFQPGTTQACRLRLRYGNGLTARWAGSVSVPAPPHVRVYHTGQGAYTVVPAGGTPAWAIELMVALGLAVFGLAVFLLRSRRRRAAT
jgi:hypothetical protein